MTRALLRAGTIAAIATLGAAAGACGVDIESGAESRNAASTTAQESRTQGRERQRRAAALPKRESGQLAIAGERQGSLTSNAVRNFSAAQREVQPRYSAVGATNAFARLCRGEVDVVDSARRISRAELAVCNANGLEIRTPIQIASDAIVLATRNESDVGGDCLTVEDVKEVYRRGSPIQNWSQLGFDDLPLKATGPTETANAFSFFSAQVLGVPSSAGLDDLRADYVPHSNDDRIRKDILGEDRARRVSGIVEDEVSRARRSFEDRRRAYVGNAVVVVRERVLRSIRAENRRRTRRKEAVKDPAGLARRNLRRIDDAKRRAANAARRRFDRRFDLLRVNRTRELLGRARRNGVVGFVRFGYYEAFEDQLRPLEIDPGPARDVAIAAADKRTRDAGLTAPKRLPATDSAGNRVPNCIFPSQLTITTGEYPLSRRILLYTSTRGLQRREVRQFLAYTLRNAQELATTSRLVPITNKLQNDQFEFVTGQPLVQSEQALPGERATGTTTSQTRTSTTTTTTTTPSRDTTDRTPTAVPSSRVPGVSSGASSTREDSP